MKSGSFGFWFVCVFCLYSFAYCSEEADRLDRCGNDILDQDEECDGDHVPENCWTIEPHFRHGTLRCTEDCTFDLTDCR